jgi:ElaB/YqjD/DUF883 family membrane-anchored ribosome-binding protein
MNNRRETLKSTVETVKLAMETLVDALVDVIDQTGAASSEEIDQLRAAHAHRLAELARVDATLDSKIDSVQERVGDLERGAADKKGREIAGNNEGV